MVLGAGRGDGAILDSARGQVKARPRQAGGHGGAPGGHPCESIGGRQPRGARAARGGGPDTPPEEAGMEIGAFIFPTEYSIRIDELARALEERGLESLFVTEHTHIPVSRRTPWPGGGELPREYAHTLDPFVGLAAAAAVTKRLKVGTGVCLVIQHDPIVAAKAVASLDFLSNGRVLFGVGAGWNAEEMEDHGTAYPTRYRVMRERVLAMKEIWTKDEAEFHGEFVRFDRLWSYPKPVQKPHPPVLLGGESIHTLRRVVEFCDGWFPRGRAGVDTILSQTEELRRLAKTAGRDPKSLSISVFGGKVDPPVLDRYRAAGIDRVLIPLPSEGRDKILPLLDRHAGLLR
jgi:probable F420-dependent oxidoreductase